MSRLLALPIAALAALSITACTPSNPSSATSQGGIPIGDFVLVGIGSDTVPTRNVRLNLAPGLISGDGVCNTYSGKLSTKFPDFRVQELHWTDNECVRNIENRLEARYFQALTQAEGIIYEGGVLKVTGPTYLTFEPGRPATAEDFQGQVNR